MTEPDNREYVDAHRVEINERIQESMAQLDGTALSAVFLLTGFDVEKLHNLGGVREAKAGPQKGTK